MGGRQSQLFLIDIPTMAGPTSLATLDGVYRYTSNRAAENQALFGNNSIGQDDAINGWFNNTKGTLLK